MRADNDKPLSQTDFDAIYGRVPRLTVEVLLRTPAGIALTRRDIEPCKGQWHLPGGTVRFGEPLVDAVRRIALGELGVLVEVGELLGYIEYPAMHADGYRGWPVGIVFAVTAVGGALTGGPDGELVECFTEPPENMIADQAEFLRKL